MRAIPPKFRFLPVVALAGCVVTAAIMLSINAVNAQYTGNENHVVTLAQAAKYIQNFKNHPTAPTIKGGHFARNIFDKILAQPGCVGIRYYYAALDDGSPTMVLVGVDQNGNDIDSGVIGEATFPCPPFCGSANELNK
jgi:hypothetical protein